MFGGRHRGTNSKATNCNSNCGYLTTDSFHCRTACVCPWTAACNSCEHFPYLSSPLPAVARRLHFTPQNQKGTASLSSPPLLSFSVRTEVVHSKQLHIWPGSLKFALLRNLLFLHLISFSCKCPLCCPLR